MEKLVYNGNIIKVTEEKINDIVWERAYLPDGVIIFPLTSEGKILLVKERRPHETPPLRIKPVSGILERDKGTPEENAQRELQEEVGLKASQMELLWKLQSTGTVTSSQYFFIARDLIPSKLPNPDGEETIEEVMAFSPEDLKKFILNDELKWSLSTLGLFRLLKHLGTIS
jgi:8-oxo-dGTP pyrophosphatase MutT (NUDIX family)